MEHIRIVMIGDVVGAPGQAILQKYAQKIKHEHRIDAIIANGENSADGKGITPKIMHFFKHTGVDMVTSGNHIWQKRDIWPYLSEHTDLLRPANFPSGCPGTGVGTFIKEGVTIGVINIQGRVFMREFVHCPLRTVESALTFLKTKTSIIVVDMHAEATSEKMALAFYFDGQVSAVVGTHTHVQTADERVLPGGTAYITDLGMCGPLDSIIGVKKEAVIHNMLTQMPTRFDVQTEGPLLLCGVIIEIDRASGHAVHIERIRIIDTVSKDLVLQHL
jgi:2',3'-cyclic-nucleotide 2'-phosphodiesterase